MTKPMTLKTLQAGDLMACLICRKPLNHTGLPIFFRFTVQRCALDADAIMERQGLALQLGRSRQLAEVFASKPPGVVIDEYRPVCVCHDCASKTSAEMLHLSAMGEFGEEGKADDQATA